METTGGVTRSKRFSARPASNREIGPPPRSNLDPPASDEQSTCRTSAPAGHLPQLDTRVDPVLDARPKRFSILDPTPTAPSMGPGRHILAALEDSWGQAADASWLIHQFPCAAVGRSYGIRTATTIALLERRPCSLGRDDFHRLEAFQPSTHGRLRVSSSPVRRG